MIDTFIWLVTGRCNYDCKYCYAKRFNGLPELNTYECKQIIREASELGVGHIAFTGGEPLMREDIFELLEEACKYNVEASITTNGSLIDNETAKRIRNLNIFLYISVDGIGDKHELIRSNNSWAILKRTFNILKEFKINFATITTLHKLNHTDIKEVIKFCKDLGANFSCFLPLMPFGNVGTNSIRAILTNEEVLYSLQLLNEGASEYKHRLNLWCMPFAKRFIRNPYIRIGGCRDRHTIDIGVNGDVLLCDVLDVVIANVRAQPLTEVFEQIDTNVLMNEILHPKLTSPCGECLIRDECLGGCYARSFAKSNNFNNPDPLCPTSAPINRSDYHSTV